MNTNEDFREQMVMAVAFRMMMIWPDPGDDRPTAEEARRMVRDVMKRGTGSKSWGPVSRAVTDLFKPHLGAILPILSQVTSAVIVAVQAENQRGLETDDDGQDLSEAALADRRDSAAQRKWGIPDNDE